MEKDAEDPPIASEAARMREPLVTPALVRFWVKRAPPIGWNWREARGGPGLGTVRRRTRGLCGK